MPAVRKKSLKRPLRPNETQFSEETGMAPNSRSHYERAQAVGFELYVSPEAIRYGVPNDPTHCVIANALKQHFGLSGPVYPMIDVNTTRWDSDGYRYIVRTPDRAAELVRLFDNPVTRNQVQPEMVWLEGNAWRMKPSRRTSRSRAATAAKARRRAGIPSDGQGPVLQYTTVVRYHGMSVPGDDTHGVADAPPTK